MTKKSSATIARAEVTALKKAIFDKPVEIQKLMWKEIIRDCPYYENKANNLNKLYTITASTVHILKL